MTKKNLSEYKRKYNAFRHHAWAGLGFLSVTLAIRLIFLESTVILTPIIVILAIYIFIALLLTYRYQSGLSVEETVEKKEPSVNLEKEKLKSEVEKERLKVEKKKVKADTKSMKKSKK
jgi:hypothetical protein